MKAIKSLHVVYNIKNKLLLLIVDILQIKQA